MSEATTKQEEVQLAEDILTITLVRQERPIKLLDAAGVLKKFFIREMMGPERDSWLNSMSTRMKVDTNGKPTGIGNYNGLHASLISRCLYTEEGKAVSEAEIQKWPVSAQIKVFTICQELNGFNEEGQEKAKNG